VTAGIVSAKGRRGITNATYQNFLQTDAAVNPGNSGGPLVNLKGQVVGINTAIVGESFRGISFAIPSSIAKEVYEQLKTSGNVVRGWLGVGLQPLTDEVAKQLGVKVRAGAVVTTVASGSPADRAGIEEGDVIVKWNSQTIDTPSDLSFSVATTPIGTKVPVVVLRGRQQIELSVTVERRPVRRERKG
jgi:S1-C subfamily serine protease